MIALLFLYYTIGALIEEAASQNFERTVEYMNISILGLMLIVLSLLVFLEMKGLWK